MSTTSHRPAEATEHFGETLRKSKYGHKMTRAMYGYPSRSPHQKASRERMGEKFWATTSWAFRDDEHSRHSDLYLLVQRDAALVNFDLSLRYFESLDAGEFEAALQTVLAEVRTLKPVESLRDWEGVAGAYVMVFDEYRQFYVGQANDVRKRIKQHWGGRKGFDRLLFGTKYNSIFPVDELRALDTTRIYAVRSQTPFTVEQRAENAADPSFSLNRMNGGEAAPLMLLLTAANPRNRTNGLEAVPMSLAEHSRAQQEFKDIVEQAEPDLIASLAGLDMTIYSVTLEDGRQVPWSRRDSIASAAIRGELSIENYQAFLETMGEEIIWPES